MRFVIIILSTLLASTAGASSFLETIDQLGQPTLAGDAHTVTDLSFTVGNSVYTLSGEAEGVIAAGQDVGFAFSGEGKVVVTIAKGAFEQANLTTLGEKVDWEGGLTYTATFKQATFFTNKVPESMLSGENSTSVVLAGVLEKTITRWEDTPYTQLDHIFAEVVFNTFAAEQVMAFLWGGDEDLIEFAEAEGDRDQTLARWKRNTSGKRKFYYADALISQPTVYDVTARPIPTVLQTDIEIEVVSPDNVMMDQTTKTQITSLRNGLRTVTFNLLNGRSETREPWDKRKDQLTVTSIKTEAGLAVEFSHKYDELLVKLPKALMRGESVTLVIDAGGPFLKNYAGDAYLVLGNMDWFPQLDIFAVQAPFHAVIKVAEPFIPLGCGKNLRRWKEGDLNCLETDEPKNMSFPFLVIGDFEMAEQQKEGYDLKVYSYVMAKRRGAEALLRNGLAVLDYYSNGMEPFPYRELEVVEIPYYRHFFWQAPAGLVEITSEGLSPISGDKSDIDTLIKGMARQGQNARYAHEIAHQWWGNLVSWATPYDNWLSESFAEYLSFMFMSEGAKEKKKAKLQLKSWAEDAEECTEKSSIYGASSLGGSRVTRGCYTKLLYGKGPLVLHALRQEIGDEKFKKLLYFVTTQAAKKDLKIITEDIIQILNALTKEDFHPWFDKYIYGTEIPKVNIKKLK